MAPGPTWNPPLVVLRSKEQAWKKIDDKGWGPRDVGTTEEITYFNNVFKYHPRPQYDLYFSYARTFPIWDKRKNRENRRFLRDIHENIFEQEKDKPVPALMSLNYGRPCRVPYDEAETKFRRSNATADFRRKRGVIRVKERQAV